MHINVWETEHELDGFSSHDLHTLAGICVCVCVYTKIHIDLRKIEHELDGFSSHEIHTLAGICVCICTYKMHINL